MADQAVVQDTIAQPVVAKLKQDSLVIPALMALVMMAVVLVDGMIPTEAVEAVEALALSAEMLQLTQPQLEV